MCQVLELLCFSLFLGMALNGEVMISFGRSVSSLAELMNRKTLYESHIE